MKLYEWVTQEMFDEKLEKLLGEMTPEEILAIPGVYEVISEELNNEALEALSDDHPEEVAAAKVALLTREDCVELLTDVSIECRDEETVDVLREAVAANLKDATIEPEAVLSRVEG